MRKNKLISNASSSLWLLRFVIFSSAFSLVSELCAQTHILEGHQSSVLSVEFSPDGRTIVTGSRDKTIKFWNVEAGQLQHTLNGHSQDVYGVTFSRDGKVFASCSGDKSIKIWNAKSYELVRTLEGHTDIVRAIAFSPDQRTLASVSVDQTARLWDVATGKLKLTLRGHTARVKSVVYSPDGKWIATAASDKTIRLWDTQTGQTIAVLEGHAGDIETLALSSDGKVLASSSNDTTIRLWDMVTKKLRRTLEGHTAEVDSVTFSPDGRQLASGCKDQTIKLWDATTGELLRTITGHTGRVESLAYSPDGKTLASGGGGGDTSIRLWNMPTNSTSQLVLKTEHFDRDPGWDNSNNRVEASSPPTVTQDFGWSPGRIGGTIWKSTTPAWYGMPLKPELSFKDAFSASGKISATREWFNGGVAYLGFFNHERQGWRPWSSMAIRLVNEGNRIVFLADFMTGKWAAGAAEMELSIPTDGSEHTWSLTYNPDATRVPWTDKSLHDNLTSSRSRQTADDILAALKKLEPELTRENLLKRLNVALDLGWVNYLPRHGKEYWLPKQENENLKGEVVVQVDGGRKYRTYLTAALHDQPVSLDRFGIFNMQLYHGGMRFHVSDLIVNGSKIDLSKDPSWEGHGNRVQFVERDFQRQNFGYSVETTFAGGQQGEIGGQFYNVEPNDPLHGYYADDIGRLTLDDPIRFSGKISFIEGSTDAGMFFGFFRAEDEKRELPPNGADHAPGWPQPNTLGVVIDGPARVGWYFIASCTATKSEFSKEVRGTVFLPTRSHRTFDFNYNPEANNGVGRVTVTLDGESPFSLDLTPEQRKAGAIFDRFGLMSFRRGGKFSILYLDDLTYTTSLATNKPSLRREQKTTTVPYPEGGRKY